VRVEVVDAEVVVVRWIGVVVVVVVVVVVCVGFQWGTVEL